MAARTQPDPNAPTEEDLEIQGRLMLPRRHNILMSGIHPEETDMAADEIIAMARRTLLLEAQSANRPTDFTLRDEMGEFNRLLRALHTAVNERMYR
jgi:hypothetical protein